MSLPHQTAHDRDSVDTAAYPVEREIGDIAAVIDAADVPRLGPVLGAVLALKAAAVGLPIRKVAK